MSSNGGASTYEVDDKTLIRRRYFREKQREYRRKIYDDGASIKAQCVHLQSIIAGLQTAKPLSVAPREANDGQVEDQYPSASMSSKGGASMYENADKIPPRRQYFREKQREYRRKMIADGAALKAQCVHLQSILVRLQTAKPPSMVPREASDGPLSWHSIAMVFKREAHRVLTDRQSLITQTQELQSLTKAMQRFVVTNIQPPMSRSNAWQNATLAADPTARNLGKEWLTQHMYHNIHEPLAFLPAVSYGDEYFDVDAQMSNDDNPFACIERAQFTWPGTVQMFRRLMESNIQAVVEEITANTRLFHTTTSKGVFVNSLRGHFSEANRFVMVIREVEEDEVYVCDPQHKQRHFMSWTEVRQISPTHILLRLVTHASHLFRANGRFVSVDELAATRGINLTGIDDGDKDAFVRRELIRRGRADFVPWRKRLMDTMHQSATNYL
ncbi:hypothetical protein H257_02069 [Aphanomyces astaci]|uniref:Uncharacterized protein n=1 Tax=Aphanomyces astaci TaxID=112090 RepID=W4H7I9_APHAT|nr:hypothetical protein H257_02069 [Aphanomyces astaci]ETV87063.1 hypothetical protein H257_02069 [Aphanomyces astaci]|eukprot:XP_009823862.1 hypothetical protein H257_02069 [Aphanomyces astaci]